MSMLPVSLRQIPPLNSGRQDADGSAVWFLGHVWLRLKVVDLGYQRLTTRQLIERLTQEEHELTIEVASLDAPERLEKVAEARLGMVRPERGQEVALP
jgi:cell division protein FtsL